MVSISEEAYELNVHTLYVASSARKLRTEKWRIQFCVGNVKECDNKEDFDIDGRI